MEMTDEIGQAPGAADQDEERLVVLEYIKSAHFRVIHADGVIGGITPQGNVHFALFSDRPAIPKMQVHRLKEDGSLGEMMPDRTVVRPGIIREMDVDVVMRPDAAKSLADWILNNLDQLNKLLAQAPGEK